MAEMAAFPRNESRLTTGVSIDAKVYDQFTAAYGDRTAKAAISKLVDWFNSLPVDAREAILSDMSDESKVKVLRAVIRAMK
jgi:hypothetical protein